MPAPRTYWPWGADADSAPSPMIAQAVILVGGAGTRLGALTADTPKPLLPVAGRPFLHWLVDWLFAQGVDRALLLAGVHGEQVTSAFAGDARVDVMLEPAPLGTGGALAAAAARLDATFLFLNGDSLFPLPLADFVRNFDPAAADGRLALRAVADAGRYGAVTLDGDHVTAFAARGAVGEAGLINGGVALLTRRLALTIPAGRPVSIEAEVYPALAAAGRLEGRIEAAPFIDIGVPEDFARAQTAVPIMLAL